jgi:hypothetical protein
MGASLFAFACSIAVAFTIAVRSPSESNPGGDKARHTFDFLGLTHLCALSRRGKFTVYVKTMKKRLRRSLKAVTEWCRTHRHDPWTNNKPSSMRSFAVTTSTTAAQRTTAVYGSSTAASVDQSRLVSR